MGDIVPQILAIVHNKSMSPVLKFYTVTNRDVDQRLSFLSTPLQPLLITNFLLNPSKQFFFSQAGGERGTDLPCDSEVILSKGF